jgi:putative addiction module killer protein
MLQSVVQTVLRTDEFDAWLSGMKDRVAMNRIGHRIDRLAAGNPGDVKAVGGGVSELRLDFGPGYRVYFAQRGVQSIVLLAGGDKSTQSKDIKRAIKLWKALKDTNNGEG